MANQCHVPWFRRLGWSAGSARPFFPFHTQHPNILFTGSMSNAESDRKADGSAEDDDEPDEWCVCVACLIEVVNAG